MLNREPSWHCSVHNLYFSAKLNPQVDRFKKNTPWKNDGNPKMEVWKMIFFFNEIGVF